MSFVVSDKSQGALDECLSLFLEFRLDEDSLLFHDLLRL